MWNHTLWPFVAGFFYIHYVQGSFMCSMHQYCIPFYERVLFCGVNIPHVCLLISSWTSTLFPLFGCYGYCHSEHWCTSICLHTWFWFSWVYTQQWNCQPRGNSVLLENSPGWFLQWLCNIFKAVFNWQCVLEQTLGYGPGCENTKMNKKPSPFTGEYVHGNVVGLDLVKGVGLGLMREPFKLWLEEEVLVTWEERGSRHSGFLHGKSTPSGVKRVTVCH